MSIHDAVRMGLENNLGIKVSRVDDVIAQRQVVIEQAVFDPFFNAGANYAKNRDPTVSILQEAQVGQIGVSPSEITQYYVSLTGKHVLGTQYSLQLSQRENNNPSANPAFTLLNPINGTAVTASLRQPLLKGGWFFVNTADVRIAENNQRLSREQVQLTALNTVYLIEKAYWDLAFAVRNREAKEKALEVTVENRDNVAKKRRIGTLAAIDVTTADSQVALRRVDLEEAELLVENVRDNLLDIVNYTKEDSLKALWEAGSQLGPFDNIEIVCTSAPDSEISTLTRDEALASAFSKRPEYRRLQLGVENQEILIGVAKNAMLPSLDLIGQWDQMGLDNAFDNSFSELSTGRFYDWQVGLELSIPLSNRGPRSFYRNAREALAKLKFEKIDIENQIVLEVDQAIRRIVYYEQTIRDLDDRVRLQTELLRAERIKLEVGKTIAYTVSVIENDLVANQTQAIRARADLRVSQADLLRAAGVLLDHHKIEVGP